MRHIPPVPAAVVAALLLVGCSREHEQPLRTYPLGDKVTVGHMVYTAFDTKWEPQLRTQSTPRVPQHRFLLVRVSVVNGAGNEVIAPDMSLEDDAGNSYQALTNGEGVANWIGALRKIAPAEAAHGTVVFDVEPKHYKLRVSDENSERAALIDLPLNFTTEAPELAPIPNAAK